jgi:hypothetical protein
MNHKQIETLADLLNQWIKSVNAGKSPSHSITDPSYQSLYLDIFFDDIDNDHGPSYFDSFLDQLTPKLVPSAEDFENVVGDQASLVWNSWVNLFNKIKQSGKLKT